MQDRQRLRERLRHAIAEVGLEPFLARGIGGELAAPCDEGAILVDETAELGRQAIAVAGVREGGVAEGLREREGALAVRLERGVRWRRRCGEAARREQREDRGRRS